ncbi:hypothetical protein [Massilibacteroides sp.]|uniref:hypothetical protein n=1 Tax=Massilibacteroides sp. TaxID=2034766 RepID=UPI00261AFF28|nr:hypothetical protein [Massilibacteroides sp.]MDD4515632.1 hypothetical protein [Massilibacteroides sp.]
MAQKIEKFGQILLPDTVYDDLQIGINTVKLPAANYPNARAYAFGVGGGITFNTLGFALNNYIDFDIQSTHSMKLSSTLDVHFHYTLPNTTNIGDKFKFKLDVIAAPIDAAFAVPTGSPFSHEHTVATNDNTYHRYFEVGSIPAVNTTVSTVYKCRLTRIAASANEYASEVYITFIDCHIKKDRLGSLSETIQ